MVLNNVAGTPHAGRSYVVAIAFFVAYGLASTSFWAYFRFRPTAPDRPTGQIAKA